MKYSAVINVQGELSYFPGECFLIQVQNNVRLRSTMEECLLNNLIVGDNPNFASLAFCASNIRTSLSLLKSGGVVQVRKVCTMVFRNTRT